MERTAFVLSGAADGKAIPFKGCAAEIELAGLLAHTLIRQRFRNDGQQAIEAMYSFPLPLDAVLLGLEIEIAGQTLHGVVREKQQASERYEDAVVGGNAALLLRKIDDGHFQMNVGNLKPGEAVELRVRYAQILCWSGDTLRYRLPTVIAPHYGDPRDAGIGEQDAPTTAMLVEYHFALTARLTGALAAAEISCPTHRAALAVQDGATVVILGPDARLDRDFVLNLRRAATVPLEVLCAPDGEHHAVLGCLNLPLQDCAARAAPHDLTILIDCSGSMQGDSIAQARRAMLAILDELRDGDTLEIVRFGSITDVWTAQRVTIDAKTRALLAEKVGTLEADLGGTELRRALWKALGHSRQGGDILVVTDGEAYLDSDDITQMAGKGCRFFTVGVGSAVSEKLLRRLADESGGRCELVTPNERMAERIAAHVRRMRAPRSSLSLDWAAPVLAAVDPPLAVFDGDTVSLPALLGTRPEGPVRVQLATEGSRREYAAPVTVVDGDLAAVLPRIVASRRLARLADVEATALAVRYQLVTAGTAMVAVLDRADADKAQGLPELARVPQMLAAGWGGTGQVGPAVVPAAPGGALPSLRDDFVCLDFQDSPAVCRTRVPNLAAAATPRSQDPGGIPAFLCAREEPDRLRYGGRDDGPTPANLLAAMQLNAIGADGKLAWDKLRDTGLASLFRMPEGIVKQLTEIALAASRGVAPGREFEATVLALADWLLGVLDSEGQREARVLRVAIKASIVDPVVHETLKALIAEVLAGTTTGRWCVRGLAAA